MQKEPDLNFQVKVTHFESMEQLFWITGAESEKQKYEIAYETVRQVHDPECDTTLSTETYIDLGTLIDRYEKCFGG